MLGNIVTKRICIQSHCSDALYIDCRLRQQFKGESKIRQICREHLLALHGQLVWRNWHPLIDKMHCAITNKKNSGCKEIKPLNKHLEGFLYYYLQNTNAQRLTRMFRDSDIYIEIEKCITCSLILVPEYWNCILVADSSVGIVPADVVT